MKYFTGYRLLAWTGLLVMSLTMAQSPKVILDGGGTTPSSLFMQELLSQAYAELNYQVEYRPVPLGRSWVEADSGRIDGLKARIDRVADRYPNLIKVPFRLFDFNLKLLADRRRCGICDISQLRSVATVRGMEAASIFLQQQSLSLRVVELTSTSQAINLLNAGKVDGVIIAETLVPESFYAIHPHWISYTLVTYPDYHYLHYSNSMLVPEITAVLEEMEHSGELAELQRQYQIADARWDIADASPSEVVAVSGLWPIASGTDGTYSEILADVFAGDDVRLSYHNVDWQAAKKRFYAGQADMLVGAYEYEIDQGLFSDIHIDYQPPVILVAGSDQTIEQQFNPQSSGTVCYVKGYDFAKLLPGTPKVTEVQEIGQCEDKLAQGQIDVLLDYQKNLSASITQGYATKEVLDSRPLFVVFHDNPVGRRLKSVYEANFRALIMGGELKRYYTTNSDLLSARLLPQEQP